MATSNPSHKPPSFFARIGLAFRAFSAVLGNPDAAARLRDDGSIAEPTVAPTAAPTAAPSAAPAAANALKQASPDSALQLLSLLQRDARLIDFVGESLADYS